MSWVVLNCPQCSVPLPRVAIWRVVGHWTVRVKSGGDIQCAGQQYRLLELLGSPIGLSARLTAYPHSGDIVGGADRPLRSTHSTRASGGRMSRKGRSMSLGPIFQATQRMVRERRLI